MVEVITTGAAFGFDIEYVKPVLDRITNLPLFAITWDFGVAGTHGADSNYILQGIARHTDRFIDEYLRVNSEACGPPSAVNDR